MPFISAFPILTQQIRNTQRFFPHPMMSIQRSLSSGWVNNWTRRFEHSRNPVHDSLRGQIPTFHSRFRHPPSPIPVLLVRMQCQRNFLRRGFKMWSPLQYSSSTAQGKDYRLVAPSGRDDEKADEKYDGRDLSMTLERHCWYTIYQ